MTLYQDEQDVIVKMIKLCDEHIGLTKQDISKVECRLGSSIPESSLNDGGEE
jgi:hypothetical protein